MGTRIASRGIATLLERKPTLQAKFREVLLAAPDIDADVLKTAIAPRLLAAQARVTVYASATDKTLYLSKKMQKYPRAGDAGDGLVVLQGMDTVDASAIETDWLSHSYYADSRALLTDMALLFGKGLRAADRPPLRQARQGDLPYWEFAP